MWVQIWKIVAWLASREVVTKVAEFGAKKGLLWYLLVFVYPLVQLIIVYKLMSIGFSLLDTVNTNYGLTPVTAELTGLAAWLAAVLRLPEAISIIVSASMFRIAYTWVAPRVVGPLGC